MRPLGHQSPRCIYAYGVFCMVGRAEETEEQDLRGRQWHKNVNK